MSRRTLDGSKQLTNGLAYVRPPSLRRGILQPNAESFRESRHREVTVTGRHFPRFCGCTYLNSALLSGSMLSCRLSDRQNFPSEGLPRPFRDEYGKTVYAPVIPTCRRLPRPSFSGLIPVVPASFRLSQLHSGCPSFIPAVPFSLLPPVFPRTLPAPGIHPARTHPVLWLLPLPDCRSGLLHPRHLNLVA